MEIPLLAALAALPLGGLVVLLALLVTLTASPRRPPVLASALVGLLLLGAWVVITAAGGVRADETGTSSSIFSDVGWLVAAVAAALCSSVLHARSTGHLRRSAR
ncbi:hypothetical protein [Kineococcus sp. SYSU DK005]|uniref:hypothetical protein n=1 Tax=Kineococcus sp. SYSU DK005 TaxID=3383126 RepID=UPI003D7C5751